MRTLWTLEQMISSVMKVNPETRDSDKELSLKIWNVYYGINPWAPVCEVLRNDTIPSMESIGRVRRKVQEKDEALRGTRYKEKIRMSAQEDYLEYSLSDR